MNSRYQQIRDAPRCRFVLAVVLSCLATSAGSLHADDALPRVRVRDIAGEVHLGRLAGWSEGVLTLDVEAPPREPERVTLRYDELLTLTCLHDARHVASTGLEGSSVILLANGDRLLLRALELADDRLVAGPAARSVLPELRIPFETVRAAVLDPPATPSAHNRLLAHLSNRREFDELRLKNGRLVTGELVAFRDGRFTLRSAVGELAISAKDVRSMAMNSEWISFPPTPGPRQLLTLRDGSWLTVHNLRWSPNGRFNMEAAFGGEVDLAVADIAMIRFLGERVIALSELEPADYRQTPFFETAWPLVCNASVTGRPLRLRGAEYPLGLGLHAAAQVDYALPNDAARFMATVGIDDGAARGAAVFAVEVDGKRVFETPVLTADSPQLQVGPIELRGAERLSLLVEFGTGADIADHANWCDPVLIRLPEQSDP